MVLNNTLSSNGGVFIRYKTKERYFSLPILNQLIHCFEIYWDDADFTYEYTQCCLENLQKTIYIGEPQYLNIAPIHISFNFDTNMYIISTSNNSLYLQQATISINGEMISIPENTPNYSTLTGKYIIDHSLSLLVETLERVLDPS